MAYNQFCLTAPSNIPLAAPYPTGIATTTMFGVVANGVTTDGGVTWTGTDDTAAWAKIVTYWQNNPGAKIYHLGGVSIVSQYIQMPDFANLEGTGTIGNGVYCNYGGADVEAAAPFWLGNWNLQSQGQRPTGSGPNNWTRQINIYAASAGVNERDLSITMNTHSDASHFTAGKIYYLRSQSSTFETLASVDLELPFNSSLVKVLSANTSTGVVTFEKPVGWTDSQAPYLCTIVPGSIQFGPVYWVQGVSVKNISLYGWSALGGPGGMYNCHLSGIDGYVVAPVSTNGFCWSSFEYLGQFSSFAIEVKFTSHDSLISFQQVSNPLAVTSSFSQPLINLGEYCRNITMTGDIIAPKWNTSGVSLVQISTGYRTFMDMTLTCPGYSSADPFVITGDSAFAVVSSQFKLRIVHSATNPTVVIGDSVSTAQPSNNLITIFSRYDGASPPSQCVNFQGGSANTVAYGSYDSGDVYFAGGSGNIVRDNIIPVIGPDASAPNVKLNICGPNYTSLSGAASRWGDEYDAIIPSNTTTALAAGAKLLFGTSTVIPNCDVNDSVTVTVNTDLMGQLPYAFISSTGHIAYGLYNPLSGAGTAGISFSFVLKVIKATTAA